MKVLAAEFIKSASKPEECPPPSGLVEAAFAGRSNVGKSSLINALCQRKKLVRVSNTPGRTRLLNFFRVTLADGEGRRAISLCDLPGYGFAKVSKAARQEWISMIEGYAVQRPNLAAVVCIVDGEIGPTDEDAQVIEWLRGIGRLPIVAATKMDRLPKHKRIPQLNAIDKALGLSPRSAIGVSATEGFNLDVLWARLLSLKL